MNEPISIFDLKRATKDVVLDGGDGAIRVYGLTARQICDHLERFPALAELSIGNSTSPMDAIVAVPGVTQAWVASALGLHRDEAAEKAAEDNLTIEDTAFIIQASLGLTFSRGFGPFVARLAVLMQHLTVAPGRGRDTRSPTRSPPPPPPPGPSPTGLGITRPGNSQPSSSSQSGEDSSASSETSPRPPSEPEESPR